MNFQGKYKIDKREKLKDQCLHSIGIQRNFLGLKIELDISQIKRYSKQFEEI